ncbi:non-hydrolyzing UDP-N-acetylglucosamine 2-epimerase [Leifsonia poae]|uniref:non-hydrolyzing UDP-N-acetylglucosamine 2-epimerase n=1 Tax=Leifsonia poae TaxID=110933 RepID=UPI003D67A6BC
MDRALRAAGHEHVIVHTGQHYAPELSDSLFTDLGIPSPDINLEIGSGSHAVQTGTMMIGLEKVFEQERSDWVLVYGDTNSTLAAAIAAVKLHQPVAHLEAGLRSGNRLMPEEHNRIVTDHVADLLLAPTVTAMEHLAAEGLGPRSIDVGDVMTDVCFRVRDAVRLRPPSMPVEWSPDHETVLATIHRAENTDDPVRLERVLSRLDGLGERVLLVAHPRLVSRAEHFDIALRRDNIVPIPSMSYSQMVLAVDSAVGVVTDSGGLQKEAYLLTTPTLTVRSETEWPETLTDGWNTIDPDLTIDAREYFRRAHPPQTAQPFGDGHAAERVVSALEAWSGS